MRVLIVEDEESILDTLKLNLELEDFEVVTAMEGPAGLELFKKQHFDLIILDVMLPELDGYAICEQIRLTNTDVPILFLTAKDAASDRITGLKKGADDYLVKPFHLEELLLRINNLLKRSTKAPAEDVEIYAFGDNKINIKTFEATTPRGNFILTKKEVMLLKLLIDRKNEVVSRQQILQSVWGYDVFPSTRTIDNFILSFRKYFEVNPKEPKYFLSVRGVGYRFVG